MLERWPSSTNSGRSSASSHVLVDADQRATFEVDWTGRYRGRLRGGRASGIDRGGRRDRAGLRRDRASSSCRRAGTGARRRERAAFGRWRGDRRPAVDRAVAHPARPARPGRPGALQVTAGAGVTLSRWRAHAHEAGLDAPVDFAARDSATIGGAIATNAGGSRVLRFGTMRRRWSASRPSWRTARSSARLPDSRRRPPACTGRRCWPARKARWRSSRRRACVSFPASSTPSRRWCRCRRWPAPSICSVASVGRCRRSTPSSSSNRPRLASVADHLGRRPPVAVPADGTCLVVDCADHDDPTRPARGRARRLGRRSSTRWSPPTPAQRRELIEFRDRITEAIAARGHGERHSDVQARRGGSPRFARRRARRRAVGRRRRRGARLIPFGHLAEGNAHLNFLDTTDTDASRRHRPPGGRRARAARSRPSTASGSPRHRGSN